MNRIKGLRQKQSDSSFNDLIPFGTDGILVDMLSGLNSEQELKLGGNHSAEIIESDLGTTIVETYYALDNITVIYIVETTIEENMETGATTIICELKQNNVIIKTKTITIPAEAAQITIEEVLS